MVYPSGWRIVEWTIVATAAMTARGIVPHPREGKLAFARAGTQLGHGHTDEVSAMRMNTAGPTNEPTVDVRDDVVVKCPATGQLVGSMPAMTAEEVETMAARLRAA